MADTRDRDNIFDYQDMNATDFTFNEEVASVFDDMVSRSVPFYTELQDMFVALSRSFAQPNTRIYDLGCSTSTTLCKIAREINDPSQSYVGIDNSEDMLSKSREKLTSEGIMSQCELKLADLNEPVQIENASIVYINWTLQFVRPLNRDRLMSEIFNGLVHGGILIIAEKVLAADSLVNRLYIDYYYKYKKQQGYSETEITKKREALENVLIPYRVEENLELLKRSGFQTVDVFFRWFNWAGFLAIKR